MSCHLVAENIHEDSLAFGISDRGIETQIIIHVTFILFSYHDKDIFQQYYYEGKFIMSRYEGYI